MAKNTSFCLSAGKILPGHTKAVCPPRASAINMIMPAQNRDPAKVKPICWQCTDRLIKSTRPGTFTYASNSLIASWRAVSLSSGRGIDSRPVFHMCSLASCTSILADDAKADHVRFGDTAYPVCPKCSAAAKIVAVRFTDGRLYPRSLETIRQEIAEEKREAEARERVRREQEAAERAAVEARQRQEAEERQREAERARQLEQERAAAEAKRQEEGRQSTEIDAFLYEEFFGEPPKHNEKDDQRTTGNHRKVA